MNSIDKLHMVHRFWRYRLRTERDPIKFLLKQDLTGATMLDIGANRGIYSYWMSKKAGEHGRVIAFEPQPELGLFLTDLKKTFRLSNLIIENKGLSDHSGTAYLFRTEAGSGQASFTEHDGLEKVAVEITTLDEYCESHSVTGISFIKCDVEDHEQHVFDGAKRVLRRYSPVLLFECNHDIAKAGELFSSLKELGYKGFFFFRGEKIDCSEFAKYPYRKPDKKRRDYIFHV
jgi:FkbM family methyltransferase